MKTKAKKNNNSSSKNDRKKNLKNDKNKKETINLDNEIVIGLKVKNDVTKKPKTNKKNTKNFQNTKNLQKSKKNVKKKSKKKINKVKNALVKWTSLCIIAIMICVLFLLSDLFNIKQIIVTNNNRVTSEDIITLSELRTDENIFKFLKSKVKNNIKTNPYIEDVKIKRKLNGIVTIEIQEREPTYALEIEDKYAYINNQGYILEIVDNSQSLIIIKGILNSNIEEGNRLETEDLKKLDEIIQIMEVAKNKDIDEIITSIDISDEDDYIIEIQSEKKTIHFGNASNINDKFLYIEALLEETKNEEGEIFLNKSKVFFRKKV